MLHLYKGILPQAPESAFIAPGAHIIGDVSIGEDSSIWYNAVLRGDLAPIRMGCRVNFQDNAVGHVNTDQPLLIDDEVSVGHGAIVHGCTVGRGTLIGMGAIVLNGADIGEYALVGAGSLVTENSRIPSHTLVLGTPARVIRELKPEDLERMKRTMESYVAKGREFRTANL